MKQTLMDFFSGTLDTGQVEDQKMMKDKLVDANVRDQKLSKQERGLEGFCEGHEIFQAYIDPSQ